MDVADAEQVKAGFKQALDRFGRLDILVNNAAITRDGLELRMKQEDWDAVIRTNLSGAHLCIQQALVAMLRQRSWRIINLTSVVAQSGNAGQANYVASKGAINALTKALAMELASRGVTVNAIAPGFIETEMSETVRSMAGDAIKKMIPMRRYGQPDDIAKVAVFLAGEDSGYMTGQVLTVDGGLGLGVGGASVGSGAITWATTAYAVNSNANALRWGTLYNFRFDADAPPAASARP